jgi:hypothetical protein
VSTPSPARLAARSRSAVGTSPQRDATSSTAARAVAPVRTRPKVEPKTSVGATASCSQN